MTDEPNHKSRQFEIHKAAEVSDIRCKRIIEGKTYNTETATQLGYWDGADGPIEEALYQTRYGAFFLYVFNNAGQPSDPGYEQIVPLEPQRAQRWMEEHCSAEAVERIFGEMPEAGEPEARFTLRLPETLRKRLATLAEERGQSLNAWILRCLETCAARIEGKSRSNQKD